MVVNKRNLWDRNRYFCWLGGPGVWKVRQYGGDAVYLFRTHADAMNALHPAPVEPSPDYYGSPAQAFLEPDHAVSEVCS